MFAYALIPHVQWKSVAPLLNSPLTCAERHAPIHGGVSHENITCNCCIGDAGEFVCASSIRRLAGLLPCLQSGPALCCVLPCLCSGPAVSRVLRCIRSGPAVCRVLRCLRSGPAVWRVLRCLRSGPVLSLLRLLQPVRKPLTVPVQRLRHSWRLHWLGSGSPRARSVAARSPGSRLDFRDNVRE